MQESRPGKWANNQCGARWPRHEVKTPIKNIIGDEE
jgi:hypothetical protein